MTARCRRWLLPGPSGQPDRSERHADRSRDRSFALLHDGPLVVRTPCAGAPGMRATRKLFMSSPFRSVTGVVRLRGLLEEASFHALDNVMFT